MNNRQRLVVVLLLFAAVSTVFLILAVPPLSTGYTLTPAYVFETVSRGELRDPSGESGPFGGDGGYHGAFSDDAYPLRARLESHVALFTGERHAFLNIGDYAALGDFIVATGGRNAAYEPLGEAEADVSVESGDSLLLNATGTPVLVIGAERIWSRGRRVLALADGGRRVADISADVFAEGDEVRDVPDEVTDAEREVVRIEPRWHYADAPLVAAADVGARTVLADALARVYIIDERGIRVRAEQLFGSSIPNISALAGDDSGTDLYVIGGVAPTNLYRVNLDEENRLQSESSIELPKTLRTSAHLEVADGIVAVAYENTVSTYNFDLDLTGRQVLDGEIVRIGFLSGGRVLYVRSSAPDTTETPTEERLNVYYADDLSPMYRLDFDFPMYSVTASPGGLVVGSDHGILLYEEGAE